MLVGDEDIDASVAIEVTDNGVARVAGSGETEARRCLGESPIEIVAVHGALSVSDEKEVQVSVVVEVREDRLPRSPDVSNSGFGRHIHESAVAPIAEQVTASLTTDEEKVQPAIVVVVRECGVTGTLGK